MRVKASERIDAAMAQPGGGGGASVDHGREPCPDRILDDIGGAFGMGAVGGGVWNLFKGLRNAPRGSRMLGGVEVRFRLLAHHT